MGERRSAIIIAATIVVIVGLALIFGIGYLGRDEAASEPLTEITDAASIQNQVQLSHLAIATSENYAGQRIRVISGYLKNTSDKPIRTIDVKLVFTDYEVPADRLIGGQEGRGLQHALSGLELGRINVAARGVGVAKAALDEAISYSQIRKTFGKPICEHQAIQLKLADMATQVEAARLLTERAAQAYDKGERCDMEAGMAKLFASEAAVSVSLESMRIHGGYGYSKEFTVERLYRDAPLLVIGEGTNELQRIIIARQLIARNKL